jgi:hypothetical protein
MAYVWIEKYYDKNINEKEKRIYINDKQYF